MTTFCLKKRNVISIFVAQIFHFRANAEADYMERALIEKSKVVGSIPTICLANIAQ